MHACTHTCTCMLAYTHTCICTHTCIQTHTHTHIHTLTLFITQWYFVFSVHTVLFFRLRRSDWEGRSWADKEEGEEESTWAYWWREIWVISHYSEAGFWSSSSSWQARLQAVASLPNAQQCFSTIRYVTVIAWDLCYTQPQGILLIECS